MKICKGGICAPKGFLAGGIGSGIKNKGLDLALIYSRLPATTAALFTKNKIKASPNIVTMERLSKNRRASAILINSGNANCLTGKKGLSDARKLTSVAAKLLGINKNYMLCASTGIIGKRLPLHKIEKALPSLVKKLSAEGSEYASRAIMTTDNIRKELSLNFDTDGCNIKIGAIAKGAGMISPHLATMLCFISTDANISYPALKRALKEATEETFNRITVDGQMSTNDMVVAQANALAGNSTITYGTSGFKKFKTALGFVLKHLAKLIVKDGEGATKLIEITVKNALNYNDACDIARNIANSPLVKTAIYGEDPNFGRILSAAGASPGFFTLGKLKLYIQGLLIFREGSACNLSMLKGRLAKEEVYITLDLGIGKASYSLWTTDLTEKYIRINSAYTS